MWDNLNDQGDYQALQHFVTSSPWNDEKVWTVLREQIPDRSGVLIIDDTGIPKQGKRSVGVKRQYSGTLGKIGNCQVAVSSILRSGVSNWLLALDLYLPIEWIQDKEHRRRAGIPTKTQFREKWKIALAQVDLADASGFDITCVAADAGYGDNGEFRAALAEKRLFLHSGNYRSYERVYERSGPTHRDSISYGAASKTSDSFEIREA